MLVLISQVLSASMLTKFHVISNTTTITDTATNAYTYTSSCMSISDDSDAETGIQVCFGSTGNCQQYVAYLPVDDYHYS